MNRLRRPVLLLATVLVVAPAAYAQPTREVTYDARAVIRLNAHLRMTTLVILPEGEDILDYVCGDKDFWVISGAQNLAYVKPAKAGATTNLNLVTASGRVYSFLLVEGGPETDLKVFVVPDPHQPPAVRTPLKPTPSAELEQANQQLAAARDEVEQSRRSADDTKRTAERNAQDSIERFKASYPYQLHFPYAYKPRSKPFNVTAIYNDGRFTYIRADAHELPALYEVIDHVPNLVTYQVDHGLYVVSKVLDHGYLAIGKRVLPFDVIDR